MYRKIILSAMLSCILLAMVGCQSENIHSDQDLFTTTKHNWIAIDMLAHKLGMKITETNNTYVQFQDAANMVLIFTYTSGEIYVNGETIGKVGLSKDVNGIFYVTPAIIDKILKVKKNGDRPPIKKHRQVRGTVVIDAGHGGKDPGAISTIGLQEKDVNLAITKKLAKILKNRGVKIVLTRNSDRFIQLNNRAQISNSYRPNLFVSIHADSAPNSRARGSSIYIAKSAPQRSRLAAKDITNALKAGRIKNRGIKKANFRVLTKTITPAVLIETGYLSNINDAKLLKTSRYQNLMAESIANGICDFLLR